MTGKTPAGTPRLSRRAALAAAAGTLALPWIARRASAAAPAWPERMVRIIVPFAPGGGVDVVCRPLAQRLSAMLGQTFVVENRPGAGGNVGMEYTATQAPDGYTLLHANSGMLTTNPTLYPSLRVNPLKDLTPIGQVTTDYLLLLAPASLPAKTLGDVLEMARAKPGEVYYGSGGAGGVTHLGFEILARQAGVQLTHVPYRGAAPAMTDLISGRIQLMLDTPGFAKPYLDAGQVKMLATAAPTRVPTLPELPTFADAGLPGATTESWQGFVAPGGMDPALAQRISAALREALESPELRSFYAASNFFPTYAAPEAMRARMVKETGQWAGVIKEAKIVLE